MTIEQKRNKVHAYCRATMCDECVLDTDHRCLYIEKADETALDRALELIEHVPSGHIKEMEPADVLLNIIEGEDVYMIRKYNNGNTSFTRLRDATVGKINDYLKKDNAVFFIVK